MRAPNIGPLADDLYACLHQIYKKADALASHAIFTRPEEHVSKTEVIAMCHIGTPQGTQVMRNFPKLSSSLFATGMAALLLGNLALTNTAQAIELSSESTSYNDTLVALHNSYGKSVLVNTSLSVDELEKLQGTAKSNAAEIETLKKTVSEQTRLIEELRRNTGTSTGSSTNEISSLKRTVEEQDKNLKDLAKQMEEFKRNTGSSSSSSSSEVSNLKREVSDQDNDLKKLASQVEDLKRSAGSSSSSSSSDLSNLKREVSDQDNQLDQLKRTVEDLSRKVK
ncbi:hypothetical protein M4Z12_09735 [Pseudomonas sp. In614]|uniref:hypothetical protein n=1 Tax=Pseudomonas nunensis TaxID=2961896 RepID=UPI001F2A6D86|nr:hypothetical protein [Pseudomonas nunensis]MCL5226372.1 hypothetical protein [Pseudomonas nunensis]